jgi:hypothetical protein
MFADWRFIVITGGAVSGGREALATATIARKSMAIARAKPKVASVLGKTRQNAPAGGYRDIDSGRNRSVAKRAAQIAGLL